MTTQVSMAANTTPHRLPPLVYPKSVSPSRDSTASHGPGGKGLQETRGAIERLGAAKDRQEKAARKRELARRHLSNSLQGMRTILPDLRRTQSFKVSAPNSVKDPAGKHVATAGLRRDTGSLGSRKPSHDLQNPRAGVRRSHSLRKRSGSGGMDSPFQMPLSRSLPHPAANISLAALVHELNASMHHHHHPSPSRHHSFPHSDDDDDDTIDRLFDYENGLDPELCPRLKPGGQQDAASSELPDRTLTPALRKLNRRRVSSRVRTQQWVNQMEREQRHGERRTRDQTGPEVETTGRRVAPGPAGQTLLYEVDT